MPLNYTDYIEYCDVYDINRNKTGRRALREHWDLEPGEYHISVLGIICRTDGRVLITRRHMNKSWAPGWWEIPGGGVGVGEEPEESVVRELLEETGIDVSGVKGERIFSYHRENPEERENYIVDVFKFTLDFDEGEIRLQEDETVGYMLATSGEIAKLGEEGIFLHYDSIKPAFEMI